MMDDVLLCRNNKPLTGSSEAQKVEDTYVNFSLLSLKQVLFFGVTFKMVQRDQKEEKI
jgi:hypothetical protein